MADESPHSDSDRSDADLMRALGGGDMAALATLVQRHQRTVHAIAYRVCGRADVADDVTQDTFLRLYRAAGGYRPTAAFRTWLYRIVVNLCLDRMRSVRPDPVPEGAVADAPRQIDQMVQQEKVQAVRDAIAALPERQRIALVLHRFERLSHGQIAQATGWSESAVESLLTRAYQQLRRTLADWAES